MKEEIMLNGVNYMNARRAARKAGYSPDYIGQLVRNDKVKGRTFGRTLFVSEASLLQYMVKAKEEKVKRDTERKTEFKAGRKVPIKVIRK